MATQKTVTGRTIAGDSLLPEPSRLQRDLVERLLALFRTTGMPSGHRLTELALARQLNVSRTPIRGALAHLARLGIVESAEGKGFVLLRTPPEDEASEAEFDATADDKLIIAISRDRLNGKLPDQVSEADLMRQYGVSRQLVLRALATLLEAGIVARKPGYGWSFETLPHDLAAREESYRFRLLIEPSGLLEPGFQLDPAWAARMRETHERALVEPWTETASVAFFAMNAGFHEGLALASGNRFIHLAVVQQTRLRRFSNYNWTYGTERVVVNCRQHLEILDRIEAGDRDVASLLMRRHIEQSSLLRR
ncbi:MAG: GntR family transcriptional regulator [Bosea sp. (in: a-proteobacteria)]